MARPRVRTADLRDRVLDEALALVERDGPAALTTRAVATRGGTSLAAVHELFGGKSGLVGAIFATGFARLADLLAGLPTTSDATGDLVASAAVFRRFAGENPSLFTVMFSRPFAEFDPGPAERAASTVLYDHWIRRVTALLGPSATPERCKDAAIALIACVHGLADLEAAGIAGSTAASIERRWRTAVLATIRGLAAPDLFADLQEHGP